MPLLVIIQVCQYLQYIQLQRVSHAQLLRSLDKRVGIQGYCGGLLPAFIVACARDEDELIHLATIAIRIGLGIGAYCQLGDNENIKGATTAVVRLRYPEQGEEIVQRFPGCVISAVTDPKSITISGHVDAMAHLLAHVRDQGLLVQEMHLRGLVHNPENLELAQELCSLCDKSPSLQLPKTTQLLIPVKSNYDGKSIKKLSLTHEAVLIMLTAKCEWYTVLQEVAQDLKDGGNSSHSFEIFGLGDCVPLSPFHQAKLNITKSEAAKVLIEADSNQYEFNDDAIAIIGVSCRLPGANNLDELWELMSRCQSTCERIRQDRVPLEKSFRNSQRKDSITERTFYGNFVNDVDKFDHGFFRIGAKEASCIDPQQRLLLELAYQAMDSSGYLRHHKREDNDDVGCFIGGGFVEYLENTGSHLPTAFNSTGTIRAFLCGRLSYHFGWKGPAEVVDTACSSSMVAIHRACRAILGGECPVAVAGGVSLMTGVSDHLDLSKAGFLSPTGQCKPFDVSADGYCRSDGAGLVVLKRLKHAEASGDQILGVITGTATNQGGMSSSIVVPHAPSLEELYHRVLQQAHMSPRHVSYVEAHGTGTQAGDPIEMESIRQVFGSVDRHSPLHVGSVKGNIGHCEPAAGIAGLLKVLAMFRAGKIPPLANFSKLNPKIPALAKGKMAIAQSVEPWLGSFHAACINSYGAAGSNAAAICCGYTSVSTTCENTNENQPFPIIVTAHSKESLRRYVDKLSKFLEHQKPSLGDLAFTLSERRMRHRYRWMTVASDINGLRMALRTSREVHDIPPSKRPVVLAFGGQNDQVVGLDKGLYETCPRLRHHINTCSEILVELGFPSVIPAIFQSTSISNVVILQTAIFTAQYSFAQCLIEAGLVVDTVIGHSLGELTAITVSGVWTLRDGLRIVATRAALIASTWGPERGSMMVVHAKKKLVHSLVEKVGDCEIACFNSNTSQVIAGSMDSINRAETILASVLTYEDVRFQRLKTSHGFHSKFADPLLGDLAALGSTVSYHKPRFNLETCTVDIHNTITSSHIASHLRNPVYFDAAVQRITKRLSSCTWLEAGFDSPIISLLKRAVEDPTSHTFQAISFKGAMAKSDVLTKAIVSMCHEGVDLSYWPFLNASDCGFRQITLPSYTFVGSSSWVDNVDRVTELQEKLQASQNSTNASNSLTVKSNLVTGPIVHGREICFSVNIASERFQSIVCGHVVRKRPLCPASMYMECIFMALQNMDLDLSQSAVCFEALSFESPLGTDLGRELTLVLTVANSKSNWTFNFGSRHTADGASKLTVHAKGSLSLQSSHLENSSNQRLVVKHIEGLSRGREMEKFLSARAYRLFSKVVTYAYFLSGIRNILIDGYQALAEVQVPVGQPGQEQSTAVDQCDAVTIDIFIQVAGLLINSSDLCEQDSVFVATGIENIKLPPTLRFSQNLVWKVYAIITSTGKSHAVGDVFVQSMDGLITLSVMGIAFTKLPIPALERILDGANTKTGNPHPSNPLPTQETVELPPPFVSQAGTTGVKHTLEEPAQYHSSDEEDEKVLRSIISSYTGVQSNLIFSETSISELGIDSLASIELTEELNSRFGRELSSSQLLDYSFAELLKQLEFPSRTPGFSLSTHSGMPQASPTSSLMSSLEDELLISTPQSTTSPLSNSQFSKLTTSISYACGIEATELTESITLRELGIDSLAAIELKDELETAFTTQVPGEQIDLDWSLSDMAQFLGCSGPTATHSTIPEPTKASVVPTMIFDTREQMSTHVDVDNVLPARIGNPFEALALAQAELPKVLQARGHDIPSVDVGRKLDVITTMYILEAFQKLGVDISELKGGSPVPVIPHIPTYSKVVKRYYNILQKHGLVDSDGQGYVRSILDYSDISADNLVSTFTREFPEYHPDTDIIAITGSKLAECLTGKVSPMTLLFASKEARQILSNYYATSPLLALSTELLVSLVAHSVGASGGDAVRIIEVGAGSGGTTKRLAQVLNALGKRIEYTFTDIASSLVNQASRTFEEYNWMKFDTLDIEEPPPSRLQGKFDIAIGTNCAHATRNQVSTIGNIRQLLNPDGCLILSEVTEVVDWYDIVWGLLDGWWLCEDSSYPLQPPERWVQSFKKAGFQTVAQSEVPIRQFNSQSLIVGTRNSLNVPIHKVHSRTAVRTVVYKEVQGVAIPADIHLPQAPTGDIMSLAMMIHGGGHMMLSRKAIRPAQTSFLLDNGVLPVSFDYRLCPEVNLIDGPIEDIRDAYLWMQSKLPMLLSEHGITVDCTKVAVIGWSTGGHLALSTAWTTRLLASNPPAAILCFYGPVDFESGDLDIPRHHKVSSGVSVLEEAVKSVTATPITSYDPGNGATGCPELSWMHAGDPRSELVLSLFREGNGLSLLLNEDRTSDQWYRNPAEPGRIAAVSPMAHMRSGDYKTPTYLIHGTQDEIAPFRSALDFFHALRETNVECGFLALSGVGHIHDLGLKPGTAEWDAQVGPGYEFLLRMLRR
ncbi:hypothetical protein TruAng_001952 [Truncatella angustata]|nr:hypothetical protein TruAng_001952 [Truncatella angustata]